MTTAPRKPTIDTPTDSDEKRYTLFRTPGHNGILPEPGTRRFSEAFKQRALKRDPSLDAFESKDLSDWGDRDIWCEEHWCQWAGAHA